MSIPGKGDSSFMNAVLFNKHGGPEVLEYTAYPMPEPVEGEVLIRLHAAALNRMDIMVRNGWPGLKLDLPHINGADGAGIIEAVAGGVPGFSVGDRVVINANLGCGRCDACLQGRDNLCLNWHLLGETIRGTYAEYICLPARQLYKLPPDFNLHHAAAAALVFQTAWHSMVKRGEVHQQDTVAIIGAGGGVNTACIRVAKYLGAQVIVIGSTEEKCTRAQSIGADVVINRSKEEDWSKAVFLATGRRGVDVVVDNVGTTFPQSLRTLRKGGRLLTVGNSGGPKFEIDNRFIFARHLTVIGSTMSTLSDFTEVMDLVAGGKLLPVIDSTYPLKDARFAQEKLWGGECFGKITLDIP